MKTIFDKNRFVLSGLSGKEKKHALLSLCAVTVFFVFSAFTFMNFLYALSDCIGSIVCASVDVAGRDALRSAPLFLSFFLSLSGLMTAHAFYRNESPEILRKQAKKHALIGIVIGCILVIYVIAGLISGTYLSLAEGAPSPVYPLDAVLYALCFIVLGVSVILYFKKGVDKHPYSGPCRGPIQKKGRGIRSFIRAFWLLVALYGFCGFFYSIFIVDFRHGYVPFSLAVMCVSLLSCLQIAFWELCYNNLKRESRKAATLPIALVSLVLSVAAAAFYFLALKGNLDGPSNVGFGILPIAFAASVNFATLLVVATPVIVSLTALVKGIIRKK